VRWRNVAKSRPETEIWLDQTIASGMTIWYHWVGGQAGLGEDRRWQETGAPVHGVARTPRPAFRAQARDREPRRRDGPAHALVLHPAGRGPDGDFFDGLYYALLEGRFFFDFVHEDDLGPETLGKYSALLLPNIAWLSDRQCAQLRDYVAQGGSLMASFETAMFDETAAAAATPDWPIFRHRVGRGRRRAQWQWLLCPDRAAP